MADEKSGAGSNGGAGKRPYATIDLKATEIKVTPVKGSQTESSSAAAGDVPRPAAARSYAETAGEAKSSASAAAGTSAKSERPAAAASSARSGFDDDAPKTIPAKKAGGFFSHLAAGIVGGALAFGAAIWALPQLGVEEGAEDQIANLSQRLAMVEKNDQKVPPAPDLSEIQSRISNLENAAQKIPSLIESQARLVAETKAALAAAASDAGSTQLIERLGKVEDRLKAMADAGVNDPNGTHSEQLAALIGKVSDLQTSLATQLTELRTNVAKDVDGRIQSATEVSETARAGTQRIDKDVAGLKTDNVRVGTEIDAVKTTADHIAADLKVTQDQLQSLKTALEGLSTAAAKPADITAAVRPVEEKTAALEKSVQDVVQSDALRKESAQRIVLALELQNLQRALDSGQNFSAQLAEVKKIAGPQLDLSALEKLQESGVPTLAELTQQFRTAADRAIDADSESENAGVVDRLWAGAKSVVRVRRIDLKADDKSTEAVVGRMQVALADGRLADVLSEAKDLSPKAHDAMQPFLDKVSARVSVDDALANLNSQLKTSIAGVAQPSAKPQP
ncbi:MAG: hypothetical protein QM780_15705 [Hyphomicrobium sp.]|uniref:COG4223 family protein n=1 Tax=Hyphomicrobium sp. TaxID=82 RepID=UPI0039E61089